MDNKAAKTIHLVFGCIASVLIIALAIMLMISCWEIYQSGDHPYTRASVGEKLQEMFVLIVVTGGFIVAGFLLHLLLPVDKGKPRAIHDQRILMQKMAKKAGHPVSPAINREKNLRLILTIGTGLVYAGLMVFPALYLLNKNNFSGIDPTAEIQAAALIVLPPALIGLVLCYVCALLVSSSYKRQAAAYKQILVANRGQGSAAATEKPERKLPLNLIRFAGLALALVFIVVGIFNGSAEDVLTKAIKICTECIGLG